MSLAVVPIKECSTSAHGGKIFLSVLMCNATVQDALCCTYVIICELAILL